MVNDGGSFLPRIQSVFYAVLDVKIGSRIVYQVPEGLISSSRQEPALSSSSSFSPPPVRSTASFLNVNDSLSPVSGDNRSTSTSPPAIDGRAPRLTRSTTQKRATSTSTQKTLFFFEDISKYVIPSTPLCGRLVKCTTRDYRIIGYPVELRDEEKKYDRGVFQYNLCFVFDKTADLSCYEPVVRKVGRVLNACEEESGFLSSPKTSGKMHAIIEQLYEDLNSYSETSIAMDRFNSIELKIFPFYPNPPPVKDWQVPLGLIDLRKVRESNWDLTIVKVCEHIDGINHVSRIAHLADCDKDLTRQAISHLLYYQVIMMIDIFQYSNMYTLRKSIQWLADAQHVIEECGHYVVRNGRTPPDWPKLLHLYSRLKPGKTVAEWMHEYEVHALDIDVRRFLSFGVIKGFLRRVRRFPILLPEPKPSEVPLPGRPRTYSASSFGPQRGRSINNAADTPTANWTFPVTSPNIPPASPEVDSGKRAKLSTTHASVPPNQLDTQAPAKATSILPTSLSALSLKSFSTNNPSERRASAAEKALEQLHSRSTIRGSRASSPAPPPAPPSSPRLGRAQRPRGITHDEHVRAQGHRPEVKRRSMTPSSLLPATPPTAGSSANLRRKPSVSGGQRASPGGNAPESPGGRRRVESDGAVGPGRSRAPYAMMDAAAKALKPRFDRSPSAPVMRQHSTTSVSHSQVPSLGTANSAPAWQSSTLSDLRYHPFPKRLLSMLDGEHHADELSTEFEAGWPLLERWLIEAGGGSGDGDFGRVAIIYR